MKLLLVYLAKRNQVNLHLLKKYLEIVKLIIVMIIQL